MPRNTKPANTTKRSTRGAIDYRNPNEIRAFLADLGTIGEDLMDAMEDALLPLARRRLGRVEHRRALADGRASLASILSYAGKGLASKTAAKRRK